MKISVKHFSAAQVNNLSVEDALKQYKPVTDWILDQKDATVINTVIDDGLVVATTIDPKAKEIFLDPAEESKVKFPCKVFKIGKWDAGNIFFQLVMASFDMTRNQEKLSTTQKSTYLLEDILHYIQTK